MGQAAGQWAHRAICGLGEAGSQGDLSHQDDAASELAAQGENSTQAKCYQSEDCPGGGPDKRIMVAVSLSLSRCLTTLSFPVCLLHFLSCRPSGRIQGKCLRMSESVHVPFKEAFGFSGSFHLTWMARIPTESYNQILWELLLCLELEPWAVEPPYGARTPLSFRGVFAAALSFSVLNYHVWVRDQPASHLHPFYKS